MGAALLVLEGIFGLWLFRASGTGERVFAGLCMTAIFVGLILVLARMSRDETRQTIGLADVRPVTPGAKEVTPAEIESPEPERLVGPDATFTINQPPDGWEVRTLTQTEWLAMGLRIADPQSKQALLGVSGNATQVLVISASRNVSFFPIPGETMLDGKKLPSALEVQIPIRLSVVPLERAQAPLFIQHPLDHNFVLQLGLMVRMGIFTLRSLLSGTIQATKRHFIQAELRQDIENVRGSDGAIEKAWRSHIITVGIEGDLQDHLLIVQYPSRPDTPDPELERDLHILAGLVDSFRPLKTPDPGKKLAEIAASSESQYQTFITANGPQIFNREFSIVLARLTGLNLDDPSQRLIAIRHLQPFEGFAGEMGAHDPDLDELWKALKAAENGDATDFKAKLTEVLDAYAKGLQSEAEAVPPIHGLESAESAADALPAGDPGPHASKHRAN
jgi:hypothetical protein